MIDARNGAEGQLHSFRKDLDAYKDKITEEEKSKIEEAIKEVETASAGDDVETINKSVQTLFESAGPIYTKKQQAESAKAANPTAEGEQTVNAEFKEVDKKD